MNGKGSIRRPTDEVAYQDNWERIFMACNRCKRAGVKVCSEGCPFGNDDTPCEDCERDA